MSGQASLKPPADLSHHYSLVVKNRKPSAVKGFYKYFAIPGISNLAGGLPNNNNFPYDTLEAAAAKPDRFKPTPNAPSKVGHYQERSAHNDVRSTHVVVPKVSDAPDKIREIDLKTALQYGTAQGYPPLYTFLRQFTIENLHPNVPYEGGPEIVLSCGNTDGFAKAIEALTDVWIEGRDPLTEKQGVLFEEFAYMNAIQAVTPRGLNVVPVSMDSEGMMAEGEGGLCDVLENWDISQGKRPHIIYTVPTGQNPTSGTLSVGRKKAIYDLCVKYDVLIVEDEPYWYLQYPSVTNQARGRETVPSSVGMNLGSSTPKSSGFEFLDSLTPSYLSVDSEGRVIRLDTFSKTVAPGCRLGWITAQPDIVEKLLRIAETSTQQPSGFVQSVIAQTIMGPQGPVPSGSKESQKGWQVDGWVRWIAGLRGNYERRMQLMCSILDEGKDVVKTGRQQVLSTKHHSTSSSPSAVPKDGNQGADNDWCVVSKTAAYTFDWPRGGMFVWLKMNFETHPLYKKLPSEKLSRSFWIYLTEKPHRVLAGPGTLFSTTNAINEKQGWKYFRLCFAAIDEDEVKGSSERFVEGVRSFWSKKNLNEIPDPDLPDAETMELGAGGSTEPMGWNLMC